MIYFSVQSEKDEVETATLLNIEQSHSRKIPYPKRVFLILGNEFCERFTFYGISGRIC